ncbi:MAG TPA: DciA family protein [Acidobacteriaceae bacterium]|nr:DciA family protein [Acidobacteriaceae bacterium]
MQQMRDLLRGSLGRSLRTLPDEDRLIAAWTVACGPALASRAEVLGLDQEGVLHVRVLQPAWREQFGQMRSMLTAELRRIAGVPLEAIHFEETHSGMQHGRRRTDAGRGRD